jgi:hypothetical protein
MQQQEKAARKDPSNGPEPYLQMNAEIHDLVKTQRVIDKKEVTRKDKKRSLKGKNKVASLR